jgi:thiol-disulfide isomerase/thioredoxin
VLVVFWASWCLPNAEEADRLRELYATFNAKGFRILGVNLDAIQDGGLAPETVLPNVRRFLIDHNVAWPTVMNGTGAHDFAKAYGVTEIPSNVLIGRDGKVVHLDLVRGNIAASVAAALGR